MNQKCLICILLVIALSIGLTVHAETFHPYLDNNLVEIPELDYHPVIELGEIVVIHNPDSVVTPIFHYATNQLSDNPLAMYLNGVKAYRLHRFDGNEKFVEIAIAGNGLDDGFSGYIDKRYVVEVKEGNQDLPNAILSTQHSESVNLYDDFSENSNIITSYPNGTKAQVMGVFQDMYHVNVSNQLGFVPRAMLDLPKKISEDIELFMPKQFMKMSPVQKHIYEIAMVYENEQAMRYGSRYSWPPEVLAEFSDLFKKLGFGSVFMYGDYIVPGTDDLDKQDAIDIAMKEASKYFNVGIEVIKSKYSKSAIFFASNQIHTGNYWYVLISDSLENDLRVFELFIRSPNGETVEFR